MNSAARIKWKTQVFAAIVIFSNVFGNFALAWGMRRRPAPVSSALDVLAAIFSPGVAIGIILLIIWLLTRITLLSWADLSYVLPVTAFGYVANAFIGHFLLNEHITPLRWGGTLLIMAGTILVGRGTPTTAGVELIAEKQAVTLEERA